jgi:hypothetical protein
MNQYLRATWRFKWLLLPGIAAALMVWILLLYQVKALSPLKLVQRAQPSYVASTQLLVDSPTSPYLRADAKQISPTPAARGGSHPPGSTNQTSTSPVPVVTDAKSLVNAANLFPLFIESDAVAAIRARLIGYVPGSVVAKALFSLENANKFRPSTLPVMQIVARSPQPEGAVRLADGTARAFRIWLTTKQQRAHVPMDQRIIVSALNVSSSAVKTGGPSYGLPLIAALAVLAAFVGMAIVADRTWPRRRSEEQDPKRIEALPDVDGTVAEHVDLTAASARPSAH